MLFNIITCFVVLLKLIQFEAMSTHKIVRALHAQLAAYTGYAALELYLWSRDWSLWGMGLFVALDIAGVISALVGLGRRPYEA